MRKINIGFREDKKTDACMVCKLREENFRKTQDRLPMTARTSL